jgi:prokaryotic ubiquitin-like protein Pup
LVPKEASIMATQDRKSVEPGSEEQEYVDEVPVPPADGADAAPTAQTEGVDDLLDEIDGVLEVNAEEFVRGFVQKGGQ